MNRMKKTLQACLICVFLCTWTTISWGAEDEIIVGVSTGYPPYYFELNNRFEGICIEIVNSVAKSLNLKLTYKTFPWKRLLLNAEQGHIDAIMPLFKTKERENFLYFDNLDLVDEENSFFTWKDNQVHFDGSFEKLQSYRIGVVTDYSYGDKFGQFPHFKKVETENDAHLITMFKQNRFDIGVGSKGVVMFNAKKENIGEQIQFLEPYITKDMLYLGFSKLRGHENLSRKFSTALQRFKLSEEYQTIIKKYGMVK